MDPGECVRGAGGGVGRGARMGERILRGVGRVRQSQTAVQKAPVVRVAIAIVARSCHVPGRAAVWSVVSVAGEEVSLQR